MTQLKRIRTTHLEVGMYISDASLGVKGQALQSKGLISKESTLTLLAGLPEVQIIIDVSKGKDSPLALPITADLASLKPTTKLNDERKRAKKVYSEAVGLVGNILKNVKLGNPIEIGPIEDLANDINTSILNNENALLCLSQIREKDQYLLEHSINVGILMGVFARHLGFDKTTIHPLVTGALLHDIGKIRVPNHVLNKPGKLTDAEWQEMQNHVIYGVEVLENSAGIHPISLDICRLHHERLDGSGYPKKLNHQAISNFGRMAAIVDVYDAITADRVYHQGKSPGDAIKFLLTLTECHLDKILLYDFIRCMNIYPVGATVELSNGKLAIVIETHRDQSAQPLVRTFYNMKHRHYEATKDIDLSSQFNTLSITNIVEARELNIKVADFI